MVEKYLEPQRAQRSEVSATFKFMSEKAQKLQRRTRMTRIFTDTANPQASAFHHFCSSLKNPR
jgi:hypothetical protein